MSKKNDSTDSWEKLGMEIVAYTCRQLGVNTKEFDSKPFVPQAAELAQLIGQVALVTLRFNTSKLLTQQVISKSKLQKASGNEKK
jgi:hypothetical protein